MIDQNEKNYLIYRVEGTVIEAGASSEMSVFQPQTS